MERPDCDPKCLESMSSNQSVCFLQRPKIRTVRRKDDARNHSPLRLSMESMANQTRETKREKPNERNQSCFNFPLLLFYSQTCLVNSSRSSLRFNGLKKQTIQRQNQTLVARIQWQNQTLVARNRINGNRMVC